MSVLTYMKTNLFSILHREILNEDKGYLDLAFAAKKVNLNVIVTKYIQSYINVCLCVAYGTSTTV